MQQLIISFAELAEIFDISERQVERLVVGAVLKQIGTWRAYRFDLETVLLYCFLIFNKNLKTKST